MQQTIALIFAWNIKWNFILKFFSILYFEIENQWKQSWEKNLTVIEIHFRWTMTTFICTRMASQEPAVIIMQELMMKQSVAATVDYSN